MRKKFLKMMLILTIIVNVFMVLSVSTNAASSGKCGVNLTWTLDNSGTLIISGSGSMTYWSSSSGVPWCLSSSSIVKVIIDDGVTNIGQYAFYGCRALTSVTIPDSVTSIGTSAFFDCTALTGITIPDSVTNIGNQAFGYCSALTSVTIPDSVTSIGKDAFSYCTSLISIVVNENNTNYCSENGVLFNKYKTTLILYPRKKTDSEYIIPDSVTTIGDDAFEHCTSLTNITIPDSVTHIGQYAFYYCTSLTNITIPDSVITIAGNAFYYCTSLNGIIIPDSVTYIGRLAFGNTAYYTNSENWENNVLYIGNHLIEAKTGLTGEYVIKNGTICVANYAFYYCTSLTGITIPDSVTSIGENAFYDCTSLTSITIPDSVTNVGRCAFTGCKSLTSATISNSITKVCDNTFSGCSSLTSIIIPDSVTTIEYSAFSNCTSLTSITIPDTITSFGNGPFSNTAYYTNSENWENNVLYIGNHLIEAKTVLTGEYVIKDGTICIAFGAFWGCESLTSVTIPDSVTSIGENAFYYCTALTGITIPDSVTTIGDDAFGHCTALTSITISDSVTSIGENAFYYCRSLTNVTVPDGVTYIGNYIFFNCSSLTSITIPDSVITIGEHTFSNCSSLTDVYYSGSEEDWGNISIGIDNTYLTNATIHYNYKNINVCYIIKGGTDLWKTENTQINSNISVITDIPSRTGHNFIGWATTAHTEEVRYQPGDIITVGTEDITLYAVWKKTSYTSTNISQGNGYKIYQVALTGIPTGSMITIACYNDGKLTHIESRNDTNTTFMVLDSVAYDEVKVFVWDGFFNLMPITEAEDVI